MEFGVLIGDVAGSMPPAEHLDGLLRQAQAAQRNGFRLLALGQHFLYGDVRWLQPIPTLARLAGELDVTVRLATTVLIAPLYHPVLLAEELATLDILSGGRLDVGLGMGYRREEFRQLGIEFAHRASRFEESIELIRRLWTEAEVTHHGRHWRLDAAQPHLQPMQRPMPPIWIGANAEVGVRRSARLGDAWPIGPRMPIPEIVKHLQVYDSVRAETGRPPAVHPIRREIMIGKSRENALERFRSMTALRYAEYGARERANIPGADHVETHAIVGTPDEVVDQIGSLEQALPVGPLIVRVQWPGMSTPEVEAYLDELGRHVVRPLSGGT